MAAVQSLPRHRGRAELPAAELAARLYEAYHRRVLRYCTTCLRSREEAEDAVQMTFLYAFRALERGVEPEAEAPWLFAIARNVCLARHRNRGRRAERETLQDPVLLQDVSAAPEPGDGLVGIEEALASLPESQRRAILLREWQGLSYREIAADLGLSTAAVETLIFRARRTLAEKLDSERASERRRVLRGFDLGSAAAGLKALLSGGAAAKLAVAAATVATVVGLGQGAAPRERPAVAPPAAGQVPAGWDLDRQEHVSLGRKWVGPVQARPAPEQRKAKPERAASEPGRSGAADEPEPAGVGSAVAVIGETVDEVVPALPDAALPELPDLPVELPPAPEIEVPELPLP